MMVLDGASKVMLNVGLGCYSACTHVFLRALMDIDFL